MNNTKIKAVMDEVATEAAERDELIRDRLNRIA